MKNKIYTLLFSFIFFLSGSLGAQNWNAAVEPASFANVNEAARISKEILDAAGVKANFRIAEARVENAMAVVHQGQRYVLYNPDFISRLTKATGTEWAAVSVLAHEIGHHVYRSDGKLLSTELQADEFSGFVLQKMGSSLSEAQAAMKLLSTPYATRTHPARNDRLESIEEGWLKAGGEMVASPRVRPSSGTRSSLPFQVAGKITFNKDPRNQYFLTSAMNVVKWINGKAQSIAKLGKSNNPAFPYIMYDRYGNKLYVDRGGRIVNSMKKMVGQLQMTAS
jgi:hypothetical protein